jgi:hypothetical protein
VLHDNLEILEHCLSLESSFEHQPSGTRFSPTRSAGERKKKTTDFTVESIEDAEYILNVIYCPGEIRRISHRQICSSSGARIIYSQIRYVIFDAYRPRAWKWGSSY